MYNSLKNKNFVKSYPQIIHMGGKFYYPVGGKFYHLNYFKFFVKKMRVRVREQARHAFYKKFFKFPFEKGGIVQAGATIRHFEKLSSLFWRLRPRRVFIPCLARDLT